MTIFDKILYTLDEPSGWWVLRHTVIECCMSVQLKRYWAAVVCPLQPIGAPKWTNIMLRVEFHVFNIVKIQKDMLLLFCVVRKRYIIQLQERTMLPHPHHTPPTTHRQTSAASNTAAAMRHKWSEWPRCVYIFGEKRNFYVLLRTLKGS